jgi:hypothetical protein
MAYKPPPASMASVAANLAYCLKSIHEACILNKPDNMSKAKLLLSTIEHISGLAVSEATEEYPALLAA